jgi:acyl-CoA thioesterase I
MTRFCWCVEFWRFGFMKWNWFLGSFRGLLVLGLVCFFSGCLGVGGNGSRLVENFVAGEHQTVVVYGTSLSSLPWSTWAGDVEGAFEERYPGRTTFINSAKGGMWSGWGVENLERLVIGKRPDMVMIEFGINDAYLEYETSVGLARQNLEVMIDRILAANNECEVILMTMNPPVDVHLERRPNIDGYYDMYRDVAGERGFLLIDHHVEWMKILASDRELFDRYVPDGIHPGPEGCAEVIAPAILKALEF